MITRVEKDFLGEKEPPDTACCGVHVLRRNENFHKATTQLHADTP